MICIFHGNDAVTHEAFQTWRKAHSDGFHITENAPGQFTAHYTQDRRENSTDRGCVHQGTSDNGYEADKGCCYTTARKVCSEDFAELMTWAKENGYAVKNCKHCDTIRFPFPVTV